MIRRRHAWVPGLCLTTLLIACQDALPVNPYDPRAPVAAQARGSIRGTLFLDDAAASPTVIHGELQSLTVRLLDGAGAQLLVTSCAAEASAAASTTCDDGTRTAAFALDELPAGEYRVVVDGLNPRYVPVAIPSLVLLPGEVKDLGTLRYAVLPIDEPDAEWTGRVEVEVRLAAGEGGARRVTLFRQGSSGLGVHAVALTDAGGEVVFERVPPGVYAVAAELEGHTPDYRVGFAILGADAPVEGNTQAFTGSGALTLHSVSAVLIPALQQTFGQYYTNGDVAPVQVLQFGGMNGMRLSTDAGFASGTLAWVPYAATADVALPSTEGAIAIHAQFRNTQVEGFSFVSGVYRTEVVRDVSAPEVQGVRVRGRTAGDDGTIWYASDAPLLSVEVDGQDTVSAVYGYALQHDVANSAGDPRALSFTLTESPGGLVRLDEEIGLTAGEGEKRVFVFLKDRAGNVSAAGATSVWVDTTAPVIDALVLDRGATTTGSGVVSVALQASDHNAVVSMQVWEEGQAEPIAVPFSEAWTLQLQLLSYAQTARQVNAIVRDVGGNPSAMSSTTIVYDDRGSLQGLVRVEDATDGSAGNASGVSALLDAQSMPAQFTASGPRGEFRYLIAGIPASSNRQLVLQKAGYGEARTLARYAVLPGQVTEVEDLTLRLARGSIAGVARLDSGANHAGIVVAVQGTSLSTTTDPGGAFRIDEVPAATGYTVVFRYDDDHSTEQRTGVQVQAHQVTQLSTEATPVILVTLQGGVGIAEGNYTSARTVHLLLFFEGALAYRASEDPDFAGAPYRTFGDSATGCAAQAGGLWRCPFTLDDADGLHRVYVQFQESAAGGFESDVRSDSVTLDRVPPSVGSVELAGGVAAVNVLNVEAVLASSDDHGVALVRLSTDGSSYASSVSFHSPVVQTFAGTEGPKCLHARFIDVAGNISELPAASDCVEYDVTDPSGTVAIVDAAGDPYPGNRPRSAAVYLQVTTNDGLEMMLSNDSAFAGVTWRAYRDDPSASHMHLPWSLDGGDGLRSVYLALRDRAGNEASGLVGMSASVYVDSTPPLAPEFTVVEGTEVSATSVHLDFTNRVQGPENLTVLLRSNRDLTSTTADSSGSDPAAYTLPDVDGLHILDVRYRDLAGNESPVSSASITLDRERPAFVDLSCLDCVATAGALRSSTGSLGLAIAASGAEWLQVSGDVVLPTPGVWHPFSAFVDVSMDIATGEADRQVTVSLRDSAGNRSLPSSRSLTVRYDPNPPSCTVAIAGFMADGTTPAPAGYSASTSLRVTSTCTGTPVGMALVPATETLGCLNANYTSFAASSVLVVPAGDGPRNVKACFVDETGNVTLSPVSAPAAVQLDQTPPQSPAIQINDGDPYTRALSPHTVAISSTVTGATQVNLSTTGTLDPAGWKAWPASNTVNLPTTDGERWVWAWFRDDLHNTTAVVSDFILLDTTPPDDGTVVLAGGQATVSTQTIAVTISGTSADFMRLWEVGSTTPCGASSCDAGGYQPFSPSTSFTLSAGTGDKRVCWHFCDAADNGSSAGHANVALGSYLDRPQPVLTSIEPGSYLALSRADYPLLITGLGLAAATLALIGDFALPCQPVGAPDGATCTADPDGLCNDAGGDCELSCATQCEVSLPPDIMRNVGTYVVRLYTPPPVHGGQTTSTATRFFSVVAPLPRIARISPRGVVQALDANGVPVAADVEIEVWGQDFMDNVQFRLGSNFGQVLELDETGSNPATRHARVRISTAGLYPSELDDYAFASINPAPGGGETSMRFGLAPAVVLCPYQCQSNLRGTRAQLPSGHAVTQAFAWETPVCGGWTWSGGTAARVLDVDGNLMARFTAEAAGQVVPLLPLPGAALGAIRLEDSVGDQPRVDLAPDAYFGSASFSLRGLYDVGGWPLAMATADLNQDGLPEVITADGLSSTLSILPNTGGTLTGLRTYTTPASPHDVAAADVDGDGVTDLVSISSPSNSVVSVRLGRGDGTFGTRSDWPSSAGGFSVAVADLNSDGFPDLLTSGGGLRAGRGDGTFGAERTLPGCSFSRAAVADLNNDGWLDVVGVPDLTVCLGDGQGGVLQRLVGSGGSQYLAVGDLNLDGALDVVTENNQGPVLVFLGDGTGRLQPHPTSPEVCVHQPSCTSGYTFEVALADVNADGALDVMAVGQWYGPGIVLGNGDGTFGALLQYGSGNEPTAVTPVDIDGDGTMDVLTANRGSHDVSVWANGRSGSAGLCREIYLTDGTDSQNRQWSLERADLDKDGAPDLLVGDFADDVHVAYGNGAGELSMTAIATTGRRWNLVPLDVNGDAVPDLLSSSGYSGDFHLLVQAPIDTFAAPVPYSTGADIRWVEVSDLNADQIPDAVVAGYADQQVHVLLGTGVAGWFGSQVGYAASGNVTHVALGDLDLDGDPDIVAPLWGAGTTVLLNDGAGAFAPEASSPYAIGAVQTAQAALGDLDGDGVLDLVVADYGDTWVAPGRGDGSFGEAVRHDLNDVTFGEQMVEVVDWQGDGNLDLVVVDSWYSRALIALGDGRGDFEVSSLPTGISSLAHALPVDVDQDGAWDLGLTSTASTPEDVGLRLGSSGRLWTQELTDMPAASLVALAGSTTSFHVHQTGQHIEHVAVRALLDGDDYAGVALELVAPDGTRLALDTGASWTGGTRWSGHYTPLTTPALAGLAMTWQPAGDWTLDVIHGGSSALQVMDFAVITRGRFSVLPGASAQRPERLQPVTGKRFLTTHGTSLGYPDTADASCSHAAGSGPDHWYQLTLEAANGVRGRLLSAVDHVLEIRQGPCASSTSRACDRDSGFGRNPHLAAYTSMPAGTHCVLVDGWFEGSEHNEGDFDLWLELQTAAP